MSVPTEVSRDFDPRLARFFFANEGDQEPIFYAKVVAVTAGMDHIPCQIDENTGELKLDPKNLFGEHVNNYKLASKDPNLVRRFYVTVGHEVTVPVIVSKRQGGKLSEALRYDPARGRKITTQAGSETVSVMEYTLPQCALEFWNRPDNERFFPELDILGVRTNPMNRLNSNRVDLWHVAGGVATLHCLYLVTLNDGKSFHLFHQKRGAWKVSKRREDTPYVLRTKKSEVVKALNEHDAVQLVLNKFVFTPVDVYTDGIEERVASFADRHLCGLLFSMENLGTFEGEYTPRQTERVPLPKGQGRVKFHTYGLGNGSYGLIEPNRPLEVGRVKHRTLQFAHHSLCNAERFKDTQGIYHIPSGTVVKVENVIEMGTNPTNDQPYPPMACIVTIL